MFIIESCSREILRRMKFSNGFFYQSIDIEFASNRQFHHNQDEETKHER